MPKKKPPDPLGEALATLDALAAKLRPSCFATPPEGVPTAEEAKPTPAQARAILADKERRFLRGDPRIRAPKGMIPAVVRRAIRFRTDEHRDVPRAQGARQPRRAARASSRSNRSHAPPRGRGV